MEATGTGSGSAEDEVEMLLKKYELKYPDEQNLLKFYDKETGTPILEIYDGEARTGFSLQIKIRNIMFKNFVSHCLENKSKLDSVRLKISRDHQTSFDNIYNAEFNSPMDLKGVIKSYINSSKECCRVFPPKTSLREKLRTNKTEIQLILNQEPERDPALDLNVKKLPETISRDKWHPVHCTMNFPVFQSFIQTVVEKTQVIQTHDIRSYKLRYLEYMNELAKSNQEFYIAVVTAFGTEVSSYPTKVLEYLQSRRAFKEDLVQSLENKNQLLSVSQDTIQGPDSNLHENPDLEDGELEDEEMEEDSGRAVIMNLKNEIGVDVDKRGMIQVQDINSSDGDVIADLPEKLNESVLYNIAHAQMTSTSEKSGGTEAEQKVVSTLPTTAPLVSFEFYLVIS